MSGNSNPSINSPASTNNDLTTLVGDDAIIAANLLQEFNDRQACHISVSSSESEVQYVPHSPTPSVQELSSPPPLRVRISAAGVVHYPPISPGSAATLLSMENDSLTTTTRAVAYGLISTINRRSTVANQRFAEVERYRRHHTHRTELEVARRAIIADIEKEDDTLQGIEHRMEAYGLHERLAALEGRMDIRQELPGRHNFVTRRTNSRRHRRGGPGGPP